MYRGPQYLSYLQKCMRLFLCLICVSSFFTGIFSNTKKAHDFQGKLNSNRLERKPASQKSQNRWLITERHLSSSFSRHTIQAEHRPQLIKSLTKASRGEYIDWGAWKVFHFFVQSASTRGGVPPR